MPVVVLLPAGSETSCSLNIVQDWENPSELVILE